MTRVDRQARRGRRRLRAALVALATALGLVLAPATLGATQAAFTGTTANPANALAADRLQPPSALSATTTCTTTPPVTYQGSSTTTGGTTVVMVPPAVTQAGDVLVAQIAYRSGTVTVSAPAGWTLLLNNTDGVEVSSAVYWKRAVAGEPTASFTRASGSGAMFGAILVYRGADQAAAIAGSAGTNGYGVTAATPSVTTTVTDTLVLGLLTKRQEQLPAPTGTTSRFQYTAGSGASSYGVTAFDQTFPGPGATPVLTSTTAFSAEWLAQVVVLRRVAGSPSAVLSWTATPSSWADGYRGERQVGAGTPLTRTVPMGVTSTTDGPLTNGVTYTYRVLAYRGTWTSTALVATLTPDC